MVDLLCTVAFILCFGLENVGCVPHIPLFSPDDVSLNLTDDLDDEVFTHRFLSSANNDSAQAKANRGSGSGV